MFWDYKLQDTIINMDRQRYRATDDVRNEWQRELIRIKAAVRAALEDEDAQSQ
jgi:hypothetical protein